MATQLVPLPLTRSEDELLQIALGAGTSNAASTNGQGDEVTQRVKLNIYPTGIITYCEPVYYPLIPSDSEDIIVSMEGSEDLSNLVLQDKEQGILIKEAFNKGIDLKDYARLIDQELSDLQEEHVDDCTLEIASFNVKNLVIFRIRCSTNPQLD